MTRTRTRREAIKGTARALAVVGGASVASADDETEMTTDAVLENDRETDYPRCIYRLDDGEWSVAMPINIHAEVPGERLAASVVEESFTGLENVRWTQLFPDLTVKAWDRKKEALVEPDDSFRRPRLGDRWAHVHIWEVDADRVAIHTHLDVLDFSASKYHRSNYYGDAARKTTEHLRNQNWQEDVPYSIDYGVDERQLARWGETGDTRVEWTV